MATPDCAPRSGVEIERVVIGAADVHCDPSTTGVDDIAELIADEGDTALAA